MARLHHLLRFTLCSLLAAGTSDPGAIEPDTATSYFQEAKALSDRDGGRLWGLPLYGPMLFADGESRAVIANGPDAMGVLQHTAGSWKGSLPKAVGVANTAIEWSGTHWTMVDWPLPEDRHSRASLMMHECFHRIQNELGLVVKDRPCGHLDSKEGRIWLQLEWRALGEALLASGKARKLAVQDALLFRAYRRSLFPEAARAERDMELNEGLAEYTGIRLSARSQAQAFTDALVALDRHVHNPTFVRSFAYASGPAYGLLLDGSATGWRTHAKDHPDLGALLQKALAIKEPLNLKNSASKRGEHYGLLALSEDENRRDEERKARVVFFRARLVDGPLLILPRSESFNHSFDPRRLLPLEKDGMVYPTIQASGPWGTVKVTDGALMTQSELRIPAPGGLQGKPLKGPGWSLDLTPGWKIVPGTRPGDFTLAPSPEPAQ